MTTKLRNRTWHQRPKMERLANVFFPGLADPETRAEMNRIAAGEGKKPPMPDPLIPDHLRGCCSPLGQGPKPPTTKGPRR